MGVVWKARQKFGISDAIRTPEFALKTLINAPDSPDRSRLVLRLAREVACLDRVRHVKNITPVLEAGEDNGIAFYVMTYVQGGNLKKRLKPEANLTERSSYDIGTGGENDSCST